MMWSKLAPERCESRSTSRSARQNEAGVGGDDGIEARRGTRATGYRTITTVALSVTMWRLRPSFAQCMATARGTDACCGINRRLHLRAPAARRLSAPIPSDERKIAAVAPGAHAVLLIKPDCIVSKISFPPTSPLCHCRRPELNPVENIGNAATWLSNGRSF